MEREFNFNGKIIIGKVTDDESAGCRQCISPHPECKEIWEAEQEAFPNDSLLFCLHECTRYYAYKEEQESK